MCAPVIVLLQSSVSVVGVVANLLAAPFVAPATVLGVATALLSWSSTTAAGWVAWLAALPTLAIARIARTAADAPLATVPWPGTGLGAGLLAAAAVLLVVAGPWLGHHARRRPVLPVGVAVLGIGAAVPTQVVTWPLTRWGFVACDVGQGDGLVLSTGPGRAVVVDAGPEPAGIDACLDATPGPRRRRGRAHALPRRPRRRSSGGPPRPHRSPDPGDAGSRPAVPVAGGLGVGRIGGRARRRALRRRRPRVAGPRPPTCGGRPASSTTARSPTTPRSS